MLLLRISSADFFASARLAKYYYAAIKNRSISLLDFISFS